MRSGQSGAPNPHLFSTDTCIHAHAHTLPWSCLRPWAAWKGAPAPWSGFTFSLSPSLLFLPTSPLPASHTHPPSLNFIKHMENQKQN